MRSGAPPLGPSRDVGSWPAQTPEAPGKTQHRRLPTTLRGHGCRPPPPHQPQGHLDRALTGAPCSGLRAQHSAGRRGWGSGHGWGSQGVSFLGWSHCSTAYLHRPGLALGGCPLSHERNVLTLHSLLSLQTALPQAPEQAAHGGRLQQPARPQAQLPCPGAVYSHQAPDLAWPPSHGPRGGGSSPSSRRQWLQRPQPTLTAGQQPLP